jgi:hypothetical protein
VATFIAFLGPGLKLARWVLDLAPTTHVGNSPVGTADAGNLAALVIVASTLVPVGFIAFHRRGDRRPAQRPLDGNRGEVAGPQPAGEPPEGGQAL